MIDQTKSRVKAKLLTRRASVRSRGKHMVFQKPTGHYLLESSLGPKPPAMIHSYEEAHEVFGEPSSR